MPEFNAEVTPRMRETLPSVAVYFSKCLNLGFTNYKCVVENQRCRQKLTHASLFTKIKNIILLALKGTRITGTSGKFLSLELALLVR